MNIGQIPPDKGRVDSTTLSKGASEGHAKRAARLAPSDHAVISGPALEQHREVSRLMSKLDGVESGKSDKELAKLSKRLDSGSFDHDTALRQAAEKFVSGQ